MKLIAILVIVIMFIFSFIFKKKQDNGNLGGAIAWSKSLWLTYTLINWFLLPIVFLFNEHGSLPFQNILKVLTISMWVRGIIEIYMLWGPKNWRPLYGIVHDIFTLILMIGNFLNWTPSQTWEITYLLSLMLSLCFETYFAYFFHRYIGEKTKGDQAVWFANKENPMFRRNLMITTLANSILYPIMALYIFLN
jgi:hypothetical protein